MSSLSPSRHPRRRWIVAFPLLAVGAGTAWYWHGRVLDINFKQHAIVLPENRVLTPLLDAASGIEIDGDGVLQKGRFSFSQSAPGFQIDVRQPTHVRVTLHATPQQTVIGQHTVSSISVDPRSTATFDPPVPVYLKGVKLGTLGEVKVDSAGTSADAHFKLDLIGALATAIGSVAVGESRADNNPSASRLFGGASVSQIRIDMKDGAMLPLPGGSVAEVGPESSVTLHHISIDAAGNFNGVADASINLAARTRLVADTTIVEPRSVKMRLSGTYARHAADDGLSLASTDVKNAQIGLQHAKVSLDGVSALLVNRMEASVDRVGWRYSGGVQTLDLKISGDATMAVTAAPAAGGYLSCDAATIKQLTIGATLGQGKASNFEATIPAITASNWTFKSDSTEPAFTISGPALKVADLGVTKLKNLALKIPQAELGLGRFTVQHHGLAASLDLDKDSRVAVTGDGLSLVLFPDASHAKGLDSGTITIKGRVPAASMNADGHSLALGPSAVNATFQLAAPRRFWGTAAFAWDGKGAQDDVSSIMGGTGTYKLGPIQVDSLKASVGNVSGTSTFDLLQSAKGSINMNLKGGGCQIVAQGRGLDDSKLAMSASMDALDVSYNLASGVANVRPVATLRSTERVLLWTKGQTIIPWPHEVRARGWLWMNPFTVQVATEGRIINRADGAVLLRFDRVESAKKSQGIHLDVDTRNCGGLDGGVNVTPFDADQVRISAGFGPFHIHFEEANPIRRFLKGFVNRDIVIRKPQR